MEAHQAGDLTRELMEARKIQMGMLPQSCYGHAQCDE
jgi:hypothetical protein